MTVVPFQVISQVSRQVRGVYFPGWGKWGVGTGLKQRRTQFSWKDVRVVWCKGWGKLNTPDSEGSRRKASWWPVLDHFKRLFTFLASTSGTCSLGSDHWIQNNPSISLSPDCKVWWIEGPSLSIQGGGPQAVQSQLLHPWAERLKLLAQGHEASKWRSCAFNWPFASKSYAFWTSSYNTMNLLGTDLLLCLISWSWILALGIYNLILFILLQINLEEHTHSGVLHDRRHADELAHMWKKDTIVKVLEMLIYYNRAWTVIIMCQYPCNWERMTLWGYDASCQKQEAFHREEKLDFSEWGWRTEVTDREIWA